jgi:hypothetical protein
MFETVPMICTQCGKTLNMASDGDDEHAPNGGDFTICLYCEHLLVFNDDLSLREPSNEEAIEAQANTNLEEARAMARKYKEFVRKKGRKGKW